MKEAVVVKRVCGVSREVIPPLVRWSGPLGANEDAAWM
jgi:hypothetical protein